MLQLLLGGAISNELCASMKKMVGFRNLAIHQYEELKIDVVSAVIRKDPDDLLRFGDTIASFSSNPSM